MRMSTKRTDLLLVTVDDRLAREFDRMVEGAFEIARCQTPQQALDLVVAGDIGLVVFDGMIREDLLIAAIADLRGPAGPKELAILVIVSAVEDRHVADLLTAGADDVLSRKLRPWGLRARLASQVKRVETAGALARKVQDSQTLMEITSRLIGADNLLDNLFAVASFLSVELDVTRCSVVLIRQERDLGLVIASSDDPHVSSLAIDLRRYPEITRVAEEGRPLVVTDVSDSEILKEVLPELKSAAVTSVALFPIARDAEVLGVIFLRFANRRSHFEERELVFCQTVANATAIALRNNEIMESLRAKTQEVEQVQSRARDQVNALRPYEDFFRSSADGMVVISDAGVVLFVNPEGAAILGREEGAVRGYPFVRMIAEGYRGRLEALIGTTRGAIGRAVDFNIITDDEHEKIVSISAAPLGERGMILLTMREVTHERLTARRLVEARERLIESEKRSAMMEVAGAAAHELNQPLTSVMTTLSMLRRLLESGDDRTLRIVNTMEQEIERMASIIRRLSKLTEYTTKTYVGSARIIDLERAAEEEPDTEKNE